MRTDIELTKQEVIELGLPVRSPFDGDLIAWGRRLTDPHKGAFDAVARSVGQQSDVENEVHSGTGSPRSMNRSGAVA